MAYRFLGARYANYFRILYAVPPVAVNKSDEYFENLSKINKVGVDPSSQTQVQQVQPMQPAQPIQPAQPVQKPQQTGGYVNGTHTMIMIGETGTGKSTIVNTAYNSINNISFADRQVLIPTKYQNAIGGYTHTEKNTADRSVAQTMESTTYKITTPPEKTSWFQPAKPLTTFKIIDTPGLNDTSGHEADEEHFNGILDALIESSEVSAVVLVLNGTQGRFTANIKNVIHHLKGSMPASISENIIVVFTMCNEYTCNFDVSKLVENGINTKNIYYVNNTAWISDPSKLSNNAIASLNADWKMSMETIGKMLQTVSTLTAKTTADFEIIKNLRNEVKSILHDSKVNLLNLQNILDEIHQAEISASKFKATSQQCEDYIIKKPVQKLILKEAPYHSTLCQKCNTVCHSNCSINEITDGNLEGLKHCMCIDGNTGNCINCGCSYNQHYHDRKDMSNATVLVDEVIQELKDKYEEELKKMEEALGVLSSKDVIKTALGIKINENINSIIKKSSEIKNICPHFNITSQIKDYIYMLEQDALSMTSIEARENCDQFVKCLKDLCNRL